MHRKFAFLELLICVVRPSPPCKRPPPFTFSLFLGGGTKFLTTVTESTCANSKQARMMAQKTAAARSIFTMVAEGTTGATGKKLRRNGFSNKIFLFMNTLYTTLIVNQVKMALQTLHNRTTKFFNFLFYKYGHFYYIEVHMYKNNELFTFPF